MFLVTRSIYLLSIYLLSIYLLRNSIGYVVWKQWNTLKISHKDQEIKQTKIHLYLTKPLINNSWIKTKKNMIEIIDFRNGWKGRTKSINWWNEPLVYIFFNMKVWKNKKNLKQVAFQIIVNLIKTKTETT